jgi:hypothetical protein
MKFKLISARTLIRASHSLQAGRLRSSRARYFEKVLLRILCRCEKKKREMIEITLKSSHALFMPRASLTRAFYGSGASLAR